jgi:hypothetical protein
MKRDMDLIRALLIETEERSSGKSPGDELIDSLTKGNRAPTSRALSDGYDQVLVAEHVRLLIKSGFAEGSVLESGGAIHTWHLARLTWAGHDFLENVRNDDVWNKTKTFVSEKGGAVTMSVLKAIAAKFAAAQLGLSD